MLPSYRNKMNQNNGRKKMIDENEIKNKGPKKVTFVEMVAVAIQRLVNPAATKKQKEMAADGLLTLAKVLDKHPKAAPKVFGKKGWNK